MGHFFVRPIPHHQAGVISNTQNGDVGLSLRVSRLTVRGNLVHRTESLCSHHQNLRQRHGHVNNDRLRNVDHDAHRCWGRRLTPLLLTGHCRAEVRRKLGQELSYECVVSELHFGWSAVKDTALARVDDENHRCVRFLCGLRHGEAQIDRERFDQRFSRNQSLIVILYADRGSGADVDPGHRAGRVVVRALFVTKRRNLRHKRVPHGFDRRAHRLRR